MARPRDLYARRPSAPNNAHLMNDEDIEGDKPEHVIAYMDPKKNLADYQRLLYEPCPAAIAISETVVAIDAALWDQYIERPGHVDIFVTAIRERASNGTHAAFIGVCHRDIKDWSRWVLGSQICVNKENDRQYASINYDIDAEIAALLSAVSTAHNFLLVDDVWNDVDGRLVTKIMTESEVTKINVISALKQSAATKDKEATGKATMSSSYTNKPHKSGKPIHSVTIYIDSEHGLRAIQDFHETPIEKRGNDEYAPNIAAIKFLLWDLVCVGVNVALRYAPNDAGIEGLETATKLANVAKSQEDLAGEWGGLYSAIDAEMDAEHWRRIREADSKAKKTTKPGSSKKSSDKKESDKKSAEKKSASKVTKVTKSKKPDVPKPTPSTVLRSGRISRQPKK